MFLSLSVFTRAPWGKGSIVFPFALPEMTKTDPFN